MRYLDHVDGLDDAGGEHPGGAAVDEGLDRLPDAGGRHRRLLLLLRVRHLSPGSGLALRSARLGQGAERTRRRERGGGGDGGEQGRRRPRSLGGFALY